MFEEAGLNIDVTLSMPKRKDFRIGCIGAGFIMRDVHLVAYKDAGFNPVAIASRTQEHAAEVAAARGIAKVYATWQELIADRDIEILDIAFPPHTQLEIIKEAVEQKHIAGILAQKPLAVDYSQAREIVRLCANKGVKLAVNQNMRYDQSMRVLRALLDQGYLGTPILATIEMRAKPFWQAYLKDYDRLTILNMSIHHLDIFRYLFGEPNKVFASCRNDPDVAFDHHDGVAVYILEYADGLRSIGLDDAYACPQEGVEKKNYLTWRVEGTQGIAYGEIGWPYYPERVPSTLTVSSKKLSGATITPQWDQVWFPDAFQGTMAQLLEAVENDAEPAISGSDNLMTMALVEACYRSIDESRAIEVKEITSG